MGLLFVSRPSDATVVLFLVFNFRPEDHALQCHMSCCHSSFESASAHHQVIAYFPFFWVTSSSGQSCKYISMCLPTHTTGTFSLASGSFLASYLKRCLLRSGAILMNHINNLLLLCLHTLLISTKHSESTCLRYRYPLGRLIETKIAIGLPEQDLAWR